MENEVIRMMTNMQSVFETATTDATKFAEGNNSAGTRVRKAMQDLKNLAQHVRVEVQSQKNIAAAIAAQFVSYLNQTRSICI